MDLIATTWGEWAALPLRIVLGIIFIVHGYPKFFKVPPIGGPKGFAGFLQQMSVPYPMFFAWVVAVVEFIGGICLILGLLVRFWAPLMAIDMAVAIWKAKLPQGGWRGGFTRYDATGYEFDLTLLAVSLSLLILGSGALGLDRLLGFPF